MPIARLDASQSARDIAQLASTTHTKLGALETWAANLETEKEEAIAMKSQKVDDNYMKYPERFYRLFSIRPH